MVEQRNLWISATLLSVLILTLLLAMVKLAGIA